MDRNKKKALSEVVVAAYIEQVTQKNSTSPVSLSSCSSCCGLSGRLLQKLLRVPLACNGFALGMTGLSNVLLNLNESLSPSPSPVKYSFIVAAILALFVAYVNQILYLAKISVFPCKVLREEASTPQQISAQVSHLTIPLLTSTTYSLLTSTHMMNLDIGILGLRIAQGTVAVWCTLQLVVMATFLLRSYREGFYPEPAWFPPTVSLGTFAMAGAALKFPAALIATSVWSAVIMMLVTLPIALFRCYYRSKEVAINGSIGILQAPGSFVCICWLVSWSSLSSYSERQQLLLGPLFVGHALFAVAMLGMLSTLWCVFMRRAHLKDLWFHSSFAGFTFPSASSANATLLYVKFYGFDTYIVGKACASVLAVLVVLLISIINITWLGKLLHYCTGNLSTTARMPSAQSMDTSTSTSSGKEKKLFVSGSVPQQNLGASIGINTSPSMPQI